MHLADLPRQPGMSMAVMYGTSDQSGHAKKGGVSTMMLGFQNSMSGDMQI